ncbi:MAG: DUF2384 domain-containing protein [Sphingobacteriaceae bacterium]|nr:DUF2384 domain-containing protein [Sphingobacteriaceae bacterium]
MSKEYRPFPEELSLDNLVNDMEVAYGAARTAKQVPPGAYLVEHSQKFAFWEAIQTGVSQSAFERIRKVSPFTDADWARFLDISTKSLLRYRQDTNHRFKPGHSETILEVAELCTVGVRVFGSPEAYERWLVTPNAALAGHKPQALVGSSYGQQLLLDELIRIDQGIFA